MKEEKEGRREGLYKRRKGGLCEGRKDGRREGRGRSYGQNGEC
jgi:hypothetical protein